MMLTPQKAPFDSLNQRSAELPNRPSRWVNNVRKLWERRNYPVSGNLSDYRLFPWIIKVCLRFKHNFLVGNCSSSSQNLRTTRLRPRPVLCSSQYFKCILRPDSAGWFLALKVLIFKMYFQGRNLVLKSSLSRPYLVLVLKIWNLSRPRPVPSWGPSR